MTLSTTELPADEEKVIFTKQSTCRYRRFQTRTDVLLDPRGHKSVRKTPRFPEGLLHVLELANHGERLQKTYAGSPFRIAACRETTDGVRYDFVEGTPLADAVVELLKTGRRTSFLALFSAFSDAVRALATQPFRVTEPFQAIFGNVTLPPQLLSAEVTNLDLIPPNVIVHGASWQVIDYEWTFDFPIPIDYVLFRALRDLYLTNPWLARQYPDMRTELIRLTGIEAALSTYTRMELAFQIHVAPRRAFLHEMYPTADSRTRTRAPHLARRLLPLLPWAIAKRLILAGMLRNHQP